jgi:beta-glucosidase/6-phospho-beta-glucosidase/beta-galactosidase
MKTFSQYICENKENKYKKIFSKIYTLTFDEHMIINSAAAKAFAAHRKVEIPSQIGQIIVLSPASPWRGTLTMKKIDSKNYEIKHNNDCTDETQRKGYIFKPFG